MNDEDDFEIFLSKANSIVAIVILLLLIYGGYRIIRWLV